MQLEFDPIIIELFKSGPQLKQLEFEIESESITIDKNYLLADAAFSYTPCNSIIFNDKDNRQCGKLTWDDGLLKFEGNFDESAKLFSNYVAQYIGLNFQG